jgi:hypothetical protein
VNRSILNSHHASAKGKKFIYARHASAKGKKTQCHAKAGGKNTHAMQNSSVKQKYRASEGSNLDPLASGLAALSSCENVCCMRDTRNPI